MKKQLSLLGIAAALIAVAPAYSETNWGSRAGSSADLSSAPATRTRQNVDYKKYQTRSNTATYQRQDGKNIYYTQPANRSAMYKQYASGDSQSVRTSRTETVRTEMKRKYFLAHPFYQPLQGKFGSITDFGYTDSGYDFTFNGMVTTPIDFSIWEGKGGSWKATQFAIKEDFSYGITDKIAVLGMLRYEMNKYKFNWNIDNSKDEQKDDGLNLFGLGAQFRVLDTADWIGEVSAYFEHQKHVANDFMLELKAGYKVARSTIYGLVRGQYLAIDGDAYGNGLEVNDASDPRTMFVAYKIDDKAFYIEGGAGVFSVLKEDWTLNVEGIFGHYDWHNQFNVKGEIGWQPNDWFAWTIYARASLYDSADGKNLDFYWHQPAQTGTGYDTHLKKAGSVKLDNNQEWTIGTRVMFQF